MAHQRTVQPHDVAHRRRRIWSSRLAHWCRYIARGTISDYVTCAPPQEGRRSHKKQIPARSAAKPRKMAVSYHWNAQNRLSG